SPAHSRAFRWKQSLSARPGRSAMVLPRVKKPSLIGTALHSMRGACSSNTTPLMCPSRLRGLDVADGGLAGAAVLLGVERDLLAFDETGHAGPLERGRMDEHVLAA